MNRMIEVFSRIIPKEMETLKIRYAILKEISLSEPIGRRSLAVNLELSEKTVRTATEFLREEQLILASQSGMSLTEDGNHLLEKLSIVMEEFEGITKMEKQLKEILGCKFVRVVRGDSDTNASTLTHIGKEAAKVLMDVMKDDSIIAVTGGHTVQNVINQVKESTKKRANVLVVPARGSLGNNVDTQANTLVSTLAKKLQSQYHLLNLPDNLSETAIESVTKEPKISEVLADIKKANILVFGIGNAKKMASRRGLSKEILNILNEKEAVAEALGYYFNKHGDMVYDSKTIGYSLDEVDDHIQAIAVAGGSSKAESIYAVRDIIKNGSIIIDDAVAKRVIQLYSNK